MSSMNATSSSAPNPRRVTERERHYESEMMFIGQRCHLQECGREDFLPFRCPDCANTFCSEHFRGDNHACPSPQASYVIPLCPLCNDPPRNWKRDEDPNIAMNAHLIPDPRTGHIECSKVEANGILRNSASGNKSKKKENQCQAKRCAKIMVVPIKCTSCPSSFCPSHRAPVQHDCVSLLKAQKTSIRSNPVKQRQSHISPQSSFVSSDEKKHNRNKGGKDQGLDASSSTSPSGNPIRTITTLSQNMKMDKRARKEQASAIKALQMRNAKGLLTPTEQIKLAEEMAKTHEEKNPLKNGREQCIIV